MHTIFRISFILTFSLISLFAVAQTPKDGAMLKLDQTNAELQSGGEVVVSIQVIRSKRFQKTKIGAPSLASSVKGVAHQIEPAEQPDTYLLTLQAEDGVVAASHTLVINGDKRWGRKIRSTLLTLDIVNTESAISRKQ